MAGTFVTGFHRFSPFRDSLRHWVGAWMGGALGSQIPVPSALLVYLVNPFCMCWSGVL